MSSLLTRILLLTSVASAAVITTTVYDCDNAASTTSSGSKPSSSAVVPANSASSTASSALLQPATYYGINTADLSNLQPSNTSQLFYTPAGYDTAAEYQYAVLNVNHTYPAVVLEHSAYISSVTCINSGLSVSFTTSAAFSTAQQYWVGKFILASHTTGCSAANDTAVRSFFLIEQITFDGTSLSASLSFSEIGLESVATTVSIDFGSVSGTTTAASTGLASNTAATPVASNADLGCSSLSASQVDGLPALACSDNFDMLLDNQLGYLNFDTNDFPASLRSAAPGLNDYNIDDYQDDDISGENNTVVEKRATKAPQKSPPPVKKPSPPPVQPPTAPVKNTGASANKVVVQQKEAMKVVQNNKASPIASSANAKATAGLGNVKPVAAAGAPAPVAPVPPKAPSAAAAKQAADGAANANLIKAANGLIAGAQTVAQIAQNPEFDDTQNIALTPKAATVDSPFGQAISLTPSGASAAAAPGAPAPPSARLRRADTTVPNVYCIGCGITGKLHYKGKIDYQILNGFKINSVAVNINGDINANINLGVDATAAYKNSYTKELAQQTFKPFTIKNVLEIQPVASFSAELDLDISSAGQIQTSATLSVPNFAATLDLLTPANSKSTGYVPVFDAKFDPKGTKITAMTGLSLPFRFGLNFNILVPGAPKLFAEIVNKPTVTVQSKYTYDTENVEANCNNGINYSLDFTDTTALKLLDAISIPLNSMKSNTAPACKSLGPAPMKGTTAPATITPEADTSTPAVESDGTDDITGADGDTVDGETPGAGGLEERSLKSRAAPKLSFRFARALNGTTNSTATISTTPSMSTAASSTGNFTVGVFDDDDDYIDDDVDESEAESDYALAAAESASGPNSDGLTYAPIYDASGQYVLFNDDEGNFALTTSDVGQYAPNYASYEDVVISDDEGRALFYYPDIMAKYGVSRFRMANYSRIPTTADFITLTPINDDGFSNTNGTYVAVDTVQNVYFTVFCALQNQLGKVFLVNEFDAGIATLMDSKYQHTITGGLVTSCNAIEFVSTGAGI